MAKVQFITGTQSAFDLLEIKNSDALYFIEDTQRLYKGEKLMSEQVIFAAAKPEFDSAKDNVLYIVKEAEVVNLYIKGDSDMVLAGGGALAEGAIKNLNAFDGALLVTSSELSSGRLPDEDTSLPTSKAVKDAVTKAIQDKLDVLDPRIKQSIVGVSKGEADDPNKFRLTFTREGGENPITLDLDKEKYIQSGTISEDGTKLVLKLLTVDGGTTDVEIPLNEMLKVDATTVKTTEEITVTIDTGNYKKGQKVNISDIQTILKNMLSQEFNPTRQNVPAVTVNAPQNKSYEVGTKVTPTYTATLSKGSYVANGVAQDAGVTAKSWVVTCGGSENKAEASGTFTEVTVAEGNNNKVIKAVATGSQGAVPKTNFGKEYDADGSLGIRYMDNAQYTKSSGDIVGYRNGFYGSLTNKSGEVNSALVRGLTPTNKAVTKGMKLTVPVPTGTLRVVIAYDASVQANITSITSDEQFGSEIKDSFVKQTVEVEGKDGYAAKTYNVYVKDLAAAQGTTTAYQVTI